jgi:DNA segregation ATPase FtsK/SpoIIIE, S-DNA-T family
MSTPILFEREHNALCNLVRLIDERAKAESSTQSEFDAAMDLAQRELLRAKKQITANSERDTSSIQAAYDEAIASIEKQFRSKLKENDNERTNESNRTEEEFHELHESTTSTYKDTLWTADSLFEAGEKEANDQRDNLKRKAKTTGDRIEATWQQALPHLLKRNLSRESLGDAQPTIAQSHVSPIETIEKGFVEAEEVIEDLQGAAIFKFASGMGLTLIYMTFLVVAIIPIILFEDKTTWMIIGFMGVVFGSLLIYWFLRRAARLKAFYLAAQLHLTLLDIEGARQALLQQAEDEHKSRMKEQNDIKISTRRKAAQKYEPMLARIKEKRESELNGINDKHFRTKEKLQNWSTASRKQTDEHYGRMLEECRAKYEGELRQAEALFNEKKQQAEAQRDRSWNELSSKWQEGTTDVHHAYNEMLCVQKERFPDWESDFWNQPPLMTTIPGGVYFGTLNIDLHAIPNGVPEDPRLKPPLPSQIDLPAYLPFPARCPLLLKVRDQGKLAAVQTVQAIMLRFLTGLPPGKVRFTIIDPVGLGDNFAAFMHLADYDEALVGSRIWTEPNQIEKRLTDLTTHMENVIQKYLRNQYKSIDEYNEQAGEVAEPYRVLVVANFPTNFSLETARRLISIMTSGSTCGVYTLISVDTKQPFPQGFNLSDLELPSINLNYKDGGFFWKDDDLSRFPLTVDQPPSTERLTKLVQIIGERSRDANKVEVPFEFVAPSPENVWKSDSRKGISVPIGRSGATKRQFMQLGQGTAQHALIAGKTGSGKSTFLHALITNLALHYSPNEIELYLIDFKKGVEFKAYASLGLPHAKVIAIESEREFGISVLQRLDSELKLRGDRFRAAGVNDINSFRNEFPNERCPRILFVVDEFQEFFVEEDKLAQEASLLLDRLVRQGRAFGLHVFLGSQTLGGAYSLARSTIDQMAVRIALQCSEADAQLILSKDNNAARLLSRPGEAIYNDANGLLEGNDLFQVVWLPEPSRERYLQELHRRVNGQYQPPLVFEGNIPSVIDQNHLLNRLLENPTWGETPRVASAWLGEAIAIKDPTAAVFRPQSGNHLLLIGQHEEAALTIFTTSLISFASQYPPEKIGLYLLDGTNEDDPNWGYLRRVTNILPHRVRQAERHELGVLFSEITEELNKRQKGETTDRSPRFVLIHGLHRYRDLRKEDDFGYGRRGAEKVASPAEMFTTILRDGPALGIHLVMWCDTLPNLNRSIDRQGMRECSLRVLFQMSANDSSTLIDTPIASRLGRNRALFVTEEQASAEKFRPYGLPSQKWLTWVKEHFDKRIASTVEPVHAQ